MELWIGEPSLSDEEVYARLHEIRQRLSGLVCSTPAGVMAIERALREIDKTQMMLVAMMDAKAKPGA